MSGSGRAPLAWPDAAKLLSGPDALERFSPLTGSPLLVVDLGSGPGAERTSPEVQRALAWLPCPTVALRTQPVPAELADRFDIVLDEPAPLAAIRERVERAPLAAMALAQLLRMSARLEVHEALVAESLVYSTLQSGPEFAAWLAARGARRPAPDRGDAPVLVEREGGVLTLILNRPERRNAYSSAMRDGLAEALTVAVADPSVTEVVLRGAGPAFCSGGDLDEFGTLPDPATAHAVRSTRNVARLLHACADRVHVRVHGACVGAGAELPAFAGRVTAAPDARFDLPELALGLVPGAGGTVSLPRRIGRQRTGLLALSGEAIDAETALAWGLVDAIAVPWDDREAR